AGRSTDDVELSSPNPFDDRYAIEDEDFSSEPSDDPSHDRNSRSIHNSPDIDLSPAVSHANNSPADVNRRVRFTGDLPSHDALFEAPADACPEKTPFEDTLDKDDNRGGRGTICATTHPVGLGPRPRTTDPNLNQRHPDTFLWERFKGRIKRGKEKLLSKLTKKGAQQGTSQDQGTSSTETLIN
ncbi:hypothetical protein CC80DRAFT_597552, partial [Byssothecium circinans]